MDRMIGLDFASLFSSRQMDVRLRIGGRDLGADVRLVRLIHYWRQHFRGCDL